MGGGGGGRWVGATQDDSIKTENLFKIFQSPPFCFISSPPILIPCFPSFHKINNGIANVTIKHLADLSYVYIPKIQIHL